MWYIFGVSTLDTFSQSCKFDQKYYIHKRLRTEELLHNLRPNFQRNRFLKLFTLPCDKCPPIKCKFLNRKSIRLCNGWYSCSHQKLSQILCYIVLFYGPVRSNIRASNVMQYNGWIKKSLHQTSAALSPIFWFQPRPPPRWPVANGRRITKAVTLENTIYTLNCYCWCHQYYCLWCHQHYCGISDVIRITVESLPTSLLISSREQTKLRKLPPGLCGNWTWADFTNLL